MLNAPVIVDPEKALCLSKKDHLSVWITGLPSPVYHHDHYETSVITSLHASSQHYMRVSILAALALNVAICNAFVVPKTTQLLRPVSIKVYSQILDESDDIEKFENEDEDDML